MNDGVTLIVKFPDYLKQSYTFKVWFSTMKTNFKNASCNIEQQKNLFKNSDPRAFIFFSPWHTRNVSDCELSVYDEQGITSAHFKWCHSTYLCCRFYTLQLLTKIYRIKFHRIKINIEIWSIWFNLRTPLHMKEVVNLFWNIWNR